MPTYIDQIKTTYAAIHACMDYILPPETGQKPNWPAAQAAWPRFLAYSLNTLAKFQAMLADPDHAWPQDDIPEPTQLTPSEVRDIVEQIDSAALDLISYSLITENITDEEWLMVHENLLTMHLSCAHLLVAFIPLDYAPETSN